MKKTILIAVLLVRVGFAQSAALKQLEMDIQKLAALKTMLSEMQQGYQTLATGYNNIKNISVSNFNLHKDFLDGLLLVSPAVKQYQKVGEIIRAQAQLVSEYKNSGARLKASGYLNSDEMGYMDRVYANLINESGKNLDALSTVMTDGQVRMSDAERIKTIDQLHAEMEDKLGFLKKFDNDTKLLVLQRAREHNDITVVQSLYGIK